MGQSGAKGATQGRSESSEDQAARSARVRATVARMLDNRRGRPTLAIDEILAMRDDGRRF